MLSKKNTVLGTFVMAGALMVGLPALASDCSPCGGGFFSRNKSQDIVDVASSAGTFNTLVAAVKAAGLVETLKGDGPYTVFAPTDAAFAKLPAGTVENLLKPENREKLKAILTYHVVPGKVTAKEVVKLNEAKTAQGQLVSIRTAEGAVMVDDARVVKTDIKASNGVIHVIDSVIIPRT